jgi:hypothetical protein
VLIVYDRTEVGRGVYLTHCCTLRRSALRSSMTLSKYTAGETAAITDSHQTPAQTQVAVAVPYMMPNEC